MNKPRLSKTIASHSTFAIGILICIPVLLVTLMLWRSLKKEEVDNCRDTKITETAHLKVTILRTLTHHIQSLEQMTTRWDQFEFLKKDEWEADATLFLQHYPGLKVIQWIDPTLNTEWGVQAKEVKGVAIDASMLSIMHKADKNHAALLIIENYLGTKDKNLAAFIPVYHQDKLEGFVLGIFDIGDMLESVLKDYDATQYSIEIRDGNNLIYSRGPNPTQQEVEDPSNDTLLSLDFYNQNWIVNVYSRAGILSRYPSLLPFVVLILGFSTAALLLLASYYAHTSKTRASELEKSLLHLKNAQKRLLTQEKLASLGALTAGIAHEIKNPLNFINNFAKLSINQFSSLEQELDKHKDQQGSAITVQTHEITTNIKRNLETIFKHGKKAAKIIERMISHSISKTSKRSIINIYAILDDAINLSWYAFQNQKPPINMYIEKNYDKSKVKIEGVSEEITHVLVNVLNNSYYALLQKKEVLKEAFSPKIVISTNKTKDTFEIRIWDNGIGIPKNAEQKIFTPFFTTKPIDQGIGLGLSLCHNIVTEGHGGSMSFISEEGQFTEFVIVLPLAE